MAAKQVNREKLMFLYRFESQNKHSPKKAKPMNTGMMPTMALAMIGEVNTMVLVIREYWAVLCTKLGSEHQAKKQPKPIKTSALIIASLRTTIMIKQPIIKNMSDSRYMMVHELKMAALSQNVSSFQDLFSLCCINSCRSICSRT